MASHPRITIPVEVKWLSPPVSVELSIEGMPPDKATLEIPLRELSAESLDMLCERFRRDVFYAAGKEDPYERTVGEHGATVCEDDANPRQTIAVINQVGALSQTQRLDLGADGADRLLRVLGRLSRALEDPACEGEMYVLPEFIDEKLKKEIFGGRICVVRDGINLLWRAKPAVGAPHQDFEWLEGALLFLKKDDDALAAARAKKKERDDA